jgi:hypothetical protein
VIDAGNDIIDGDQESDDSDGNACIKDCGLAHERINLPFLTFINRNEYKLLILLFLTVFPSQDLIDHIPRKNTEASHW